MALTLFTGGSHSVTSTEYSIISEATYNSASTFSTSSGVYQLFLDTDNLGVGDELQVTIYGKVTSGSTQRVVYRQLLCHGPGDALSGFVFPALALYDAWDMTLKMISGGATIAWEVKKVAVVAELFSGTQAIDTTEWSTATDTAGPDVQTSDHIIQLWLDLSDMVTGDQLRIRTGEGGGTTYTAYEYGPQALPVWIGPTFGLLSGWDWTLTAPAGTITVNWSVRSVT